MAMKLQKERIEQPRKTEIYFRGTEKFLIRMIAVVVISIIALLIVLIFIEANRPIYVEISEQEAKWLLENGKWQSEESEQSELLRERPDANQF